MPPMLWNELPAISLRCAAPWKDSLLGLLADAEHNKLRWNLALVIPRLALSPAEARRAAESLRTYLDDKSSIVKTCAMQGLAELTRHDPSLLPEVLDSASHPLAKWNAGHAGPRAYPVAAA